jgi:hypothetical protein
MTQVVKKLVIFALMLAALPVGAEPEDGDMVRVVTGPARPADCLAPVAVNKIDGQARVVSAQGFLIEPGVHTINGRASLDTTYCPVTGDDLQSGSTADLEVDFEAGRTYYIGYDHKSQNAAEWRLLVWKVELDGPSEIHSQ